VRFVLRKTPNPEDVLGSSIGLTLCSLITVEALPRRTAFVISSRSRACAFVWKWRCAALSINQIARASPSAPWMAASLSLSALWFMAILSGSDASCSQVVKRRIARAFCFAALYL
jgi:hypothetical protein